MNTKQSSKEILLARTREFVAEFDQESDRAAVILSIAYLENALRLVLLRSLVACPTSNDPLFDGVNAPIGSFSSKIELAFRLGLISERFARDLNIIRKIRNKYAHEIHGCSFEDSETQDRIGTLMESWRPLNKFVGRYDLPETPRNNFLFISHWMMMWLYVNADNLIRIQRAEQELGYNFDDFTDKKEDQEL